MEYLSPGTATLIRIALWLAVQTPFSVRILTSTLDPIDAWIGHSQKVAKDHYLMVKPDHWEKAVGESKKEVLEKEVSDKTAHSTEPSAQ